MTDLHTKALSPVTDPAIVPCVRTVANSQTGLAWPALILFLAAFMLRWAGFGNPVLAVDEQFYLLVGDRVLQGAMPFMDIWDRKPVGLFLIYAGIRLLGGEGIYQYQIVATLFAGTTALVITNIATACARPPGAVIAGIVYLIWLNIFGGEGGQSPVFYNLFVALAAWLILRRIHQPAPSFLGVGCGAMLLVGVAIQIKYTVVFEGIFFGCFLLWQSWRFGGGLLDLVPRGVIWIACALLPTTLALVFYMSQGLGDDFVFANFLSVLQRSPPAEGSSLLRFTNVALRLLPLAVCAALGCWPRLGTGNGPARVFLAMWSVAAVAGFLVFGTYYMHYALPMLVPLAAAAAPVFGHLRFGLLLSRRPGAWQAALSSCVIAFGLINAVMLTARHRQLRGTGPEIRSIVDVIKPELRGCIFVFDGEPILYHLTGSCIPTRYAFPSHLNDLKEAAAIGVDPFSEVIRVFATHPDFIISSKVPRPRNDMRVWGAVEAELAQHYHSVLEVSVGRQTRILYRRGRPAGTE